VSSTSSVLSGKRSAVATGWLFFWFKETFEKLSLSFLSCLSLIHWLTSCQVCLSSIDIVFVHVWREVNNSFDSKLIHKIWSNSNQFCMDSCCIRSCNRHQGSLRQRVT
jgi:hypothetical protein